MNYKNIIVMSLVEVYFLIFIIICYKDIYIMYLCKCFIYLLILYFYIIIYIFLYIY